MGIADYVLDIDYQSGGVLFQADFFEKRGEVGVSRTGETGLTNRSVPHLPTPSYSCSCNHRSASIAAMHPLPAAVIACLKLESCTSPAAKTPGIFVLVDPGTVLR
jgi:hypothetical protein